MALGIGSGISIGGGSSVASSTIQVAQLPGIYFVFFIQGQTGPATYNYPFTLS